MTKRPFVNNLKGKISMLTLFGCCVASGVVGMAFLQQLANDLMVPVMGYTSIIEIDMNMFFAIGDDTAKKTVNPVPEPGTVLLVASGMVGLIAFRRKRLIDRGKSL